jgi:hypothetical protein
MEHQSHVGIEGPSARRVHRTTSMSSSATDRRVSGLIFVALTVAGAFALFGAAAPQSVSVDDGEPELDAGVPDAAAAQPDGRQTEAAMQQIELLQNLNDQLGGLREQLAEDEAFRESESAATQQAFAQTQSAVDALSTTEQRLAYGDSDVLDALSSASPSLPYPAQLAVANARGAIEREDLADARYWISVAIGETQRSQLGP